MFYLILNEDHEYNHLDSRGNKYLSARSILFDVLLPVYCLTSINLTQFLQSTKVMPIWVTVTFLREQHTEARHDPSTKNKA